MKTTSEFVQVVADSPAGIPLVSLDDLGRKICKRCVESSQVTVYAKRVYSYVPDNTLGGEIVREAWNRVVSSM